MCLLPGLSLAFLVMSIPYLNLAIQDGFCCARRIQMQEGLTEIVIREGWSWWPRGMRPRWDANHNGITSLSAHNDADSFCISACSGISAYSGRAYCSHDDVMWSVCLLTRLTLPQGLSRFRASLANM
eukprot:1160387-Pelagomonas_calceolata.AAC.13